MIVITEKPVQGHNQSTMARHSHSPWKNSTQTLTIFTSNSFFAVNFLCYTCGKESNGAMNGALGHGESICKDISYAIS